MEIIISNKRFSVKIDEDANIYDALDGVAAALQLEDFAPETICQGFVNKAKSMTEEYNIKRSSQS